MKRSTRAPWSNRGMRMIRLHPTSRRVLSEAWASPGHRSTVGRNTGDVGRSGPVDACRWQAHGILSREGAAEAGSSTGPEDLRSQRFLLMSFPRHALSRGPIRENNRFPPSSFAMYTLMHGGGVLISYSRGGFLSGDRSSVVSRPWSVVRPGGESVVRGSP